MTATTPNPHDATTKPCTPPAKDAATTPKSAEPSASTETGAAAVHTAGTPRWIHPAINGPTIEVDYTCYRCGAIFTITQWEPGRDEDIDLCWGCIDRLFGR